jgi:CheY-like chemotaxis protein
MTDLISLLLVEDQNADLWRDILQQSNGFDITVALDGNQALLYAAKTKFDVIVLDIRIPFQDGFAVVRQIRAGNSPNRDTPILAMSAYTDKTTRRKIIDAGADDFLTRDFDYSRLHQKILELAVAFPRESDVEKEELLTAQRRLNKLRLQKARMGNDVPAHLEIEIEDLSKQIREWGSKRKQSRGG